MNDLDRLSGDPTLASIARDVFAAADGLQVSELTNERRSTSTVTRALGTLRGYGVVTDGAQRKSAGRPATTVKARATIGIVGISVLGAGGEPSTLIGVVTDLAGRNILDDTQISVALAMPQRSNPDALARAIADLAVELVDNARGQIAIVGLGVSIGGHVRKGVLERFPGLPWDPYPLQDELHQRTGLAVRVDNDATAFAVEMAVHGTVPRRGSVAVLALFGDGVGGAWIVDGRVRRGARGAAMEPGHLAVAADDDLFKHLKEIVHLGDDDRTPEELMTGKCRCGALNCVEAYASPSKIREALKKADQGQGLDLDSAALKPVDGDVVATKIFSLSGYALGRGIGNIVNTFDPDLVLVHVPTVLANAKRASLAETWRDVLYRTVAESDFANRCDGIEETHQRVRICELTAQRLERGTAVAAACLVSESLLNQLAGHDVGPASVINARQLAGT